MSPLLLIVFIPLFVGGVAFVALLFAAATAGSRDAFEQRPREGTTAAEEVLSRGAPSEPSSARAACDEANRLPRTGKGLKASLPCPAPIRTDPK